MRARRAGHGARRVLSCVVPLAAGDGPARRLRPSPGGVSMGLLLLLACARVLWCDACQVPGARTRRTQANSSSSVPTTWRHRLAPWGGRLSAAWTWPHTHTISLLAHTQRCCRPSLWPPPTSSLPGTSRSAATASRCMQQTDSWWPRQGACQGGQVFVRGGRLSGSSSVASGVQVAARPPVFSPLQNRHCRAPCSPVVSLRRSGAQAEGDRRGCNQARLVARQPECTSTAPHARAPCPLNHPSRLQLCRQIPGVTIGLPQPPAAAGNAPYTFLAAATPWAANAAARPGVGPLIHRRVGSGRAAACLWFACCTPAQSCRSSAACAALMTPAHSLTH